MKSTLIPVLAALAGTAVATPQEAPAPQGTVLPAVAILKARQGTSLPPTHHIEDTCAAPEIEGVPAAADCAEVFQYFKDHADEPLDVKVPVGEMETLRCDENCVLSFYPLEDGEYTNADVVEGIEKLVEQCADGKDDGKVGGAVGVAENKVLVAVDPTAGTGCVL